MKFCAFFLFSCSALSLKASTAPLVDYLSADVDFAASVRSISETREAWSGHPFAEVFADESLRAYLAALFDSGESDKLAGITRVMEEEFDLTWEELAELMPGQFSFGFYNVAEMILEEQDRPDLVVMAEFSGTPERLNELMEIQFERNAEAQREINPLMEHELIEETFLGETLYFDEAFNGEKTYIEDGYALVDGVLVIATPAERLRMAVEAIKEGPEDALSESGAYQRVREGRARPDFNLFLNLEALMPPLNARLSERAAQGLAMFGVTTQSFNAALSLESLQALGIDFSLREDGVMTHSALVYREKAGLLSLMSYAPVPLPEAPYVPEKILSSSISSFDLSAMFENLETLLATASPGLPMLLDIQLQNIQTETGVDLRTAVLRNFGEEVVSLSILPDDLKGTEGMLQPEQVFIIQVNDAAALSGAFEALKDKVPGLRAQLEMQEFEGQTIHTIKGVPNPQVPEARVNDVSYVITRTHFILNMGRVGLLQQVISAMQTEDSGFWQQPDVEALFDEIAEADAVSRTYFDLGQMILPILKSIPMHPAMRGGATLDVTKLPESLEAPFLLLSEVNELPDGLFSRSLIIEAEGSE
jgi:hypothetical protein